jgi:hypothetical protein
LLYLLRRAFWQGRSELRRRDATRGFVKEYTRNWQTIDPRLLRILLTGMYLTAVAAGIVCESVVSRTRNDITRP